MDFQSSTGMTPAGEQRDAPVADPKSRGGDEDGAAPDSGIVTGPGATPALKTAIEDVLRTVYDPEIPVDIFELGLVYGVELDTDRNAFIKMTLTSPMCPVAGELPAEVELKIRSVEEVKGTQLEVVWEPPWSPAMMSDAAKLTLGF